jgi:hypothetical protein
MKGTELALKVEALRPQAKILLMSAYMLSKVTATGRPFLAKPFSLNGLATKVRAVLDGDNLIDVQIAILAKQSVNPVYVVFAGSITTLDRNTKRVSIGRGFDQHIDLSACSIWLAEQRAFHNGSTRDITHRAVDDLDQPLKVV